jgi:hypothetical protein
MTAMRKHKNFWDKNADRYDRFMRKDRAAYEKMYALIQPVVKAKTAGACYRHGIDRKTHRERGGTHRGDGRLPGDDCRGEAG